MYKKSKTSLLRDKKLAETVKFLSFVWMTQCQVVLEVTVAECSTQLVQRRKTLVVRTTNFTMFTFPINTEGMLIWIGLSIKADFAIYWERLDSCKSLQEWMHVLVTNYALLLLLI